MVLHSNLAILLVHIVFPKQILAYIDTFNIFFCNGPIKMAYCPKTRLDVWGTPNYFIWNRISTPIPFKVKCYLERVLTQANNGDELFWEEKFHAANNGKAQVCTQGALLFSLLSFGGKGGLGGIFFHFSLLPNVFPLCSFKGPMGSHEVPTMFTKFTMCSQTWTP